MDPKEKELSELKAQLATLATQVATLTTERDTAKKEATTFKETVDKLGKDIKAKDTLIETQKGQIVGQRRKLSERTKEELDEMTDAEKEALKRTEDIESETKARIDALEKSNNEEKTRLREASVNSLINKYASKPEIQEAIKKNLGRLADFPKALTPEELESGVKTAINMLGTIPKDSLNAAFTAGGGEAPGDTSRKGDFADSPEGQAMLAKIAPAAVEAKK